MLESHSDESQPHIAVSHYLSVILYICKNHAESTTAMDKEPIHKNVLDTPFRSSVTGKYKLLIKSVTYKAFNYEYELMDTDGNKYAAGHPKHYVEGTLLRCMVYFKIANANLVVTETLICNKQNLTVGIQGKKVIVQSKTAVKPSAKPKFVDDPRNIGKSYHQ